MFKNLFSKLIVVVLMVLAFFFGQMTAQPVRTVEAGGPPPGVKLMSEPDIAPSESIGIGSNCVVFCGTQSELDDIVKKWMGKKDIPVSGKKPTEKPSVTPSATPSSTPTPAGTPTPELTTVPKTATPSKTATVVPSKTATPKASETPVVTETPAPPLDGNPGNAKPVGKAGEKCGKGFYCPEEGGPGTKGKSDGTKTPKP